MKFGVNFYSETADELYNTIVQTYKAGDYNKSIGLSKKFVKTYKNDEKRNQVLLDKMIPRHNKYMNATTKIFNLEVIL